MSLQTLKASQLYKENNPSFIFFTELDKKNKIDKDLNLKEVHQKIEKITKQLKCHQLTDMKEWAQIQYYKLRQLEKGLVTNNRTKVISKSLRESLRILIFVCNNLNIQFDMKNVEKLIKNVYSKEYQSEDIQQYCIKAGFSIKGSDVLEYRPEKNWFLSVFCCCRSS